MPTYDLNVLKQKDFLFDSKPIGGRAFDSSEVRTLQCYYQNEKNLLGLGIYLPAKECQLTREKNDVDAIMLKGDYDILVTATTNFYKHNLTGATQPSSAGFQGGELVIPELDSDGTSELSSIM